MHINSYYFKKDKIIGMNVNQNPLLEKSRLAHLHFIIAKGAVNEDIKLKYASEKQVQLNIETYLEGLRLSEHSFMNTSGLKVMRITSLIGL